MISTELLRALVSAGATLVIRPSPCATNHYPTVNMELSKGDLVLRYSEYLPEHINQSLLNSLASRSFQEGR